MPTYKPSKPCGKCSKCLRRAREQAEKDALAHFCAHSYPYGYSVYNPTDLSETHSIRTFSSSDGRMSHHNSGDSSLRRQNSFGFSGYSPTDQSEAYSTHTFSSADGRLSRQNSAPTSSKRRNAFTAVQHNTNSKSQSAHYYAANLYSPNDSYHPIFKTKVHHRYNQVTGKYDSSYITKTVRRSVDKENEDSAEDILAMVVRCAQKTAQVVRAFCLEKDTHGWTMEVVVPEMTEVKKRYTSYRKAATSLHDVLYMNDYSGADRYTYTAPALKEEYIPNMETYISNTGWYTNSKSIPAKLITSLPPYSYQWSGHKFMIAGLKASVDHRRMHIKISSPELFSQLGEVYGSQDLGMKGIYNHFYWHRSNRFCSDIAKPKENYCYYKPTPTTRTS